MIYAQRPDATACASMELWNDTMRRWVKPRSKGIALIRTGAGGRPRLEYVFDVADTRPVRGAREPYLWEMTAEKSGAVAAALERQYGPTEEHDIGWALMEQVSRAVGGAYRDYLEDLRYDTRDSFLEELDDLNLEVRYKNLLTASVQFTILTRCGLDPSEYLEDEDLAGITEFSTPAVLHHLGRAASKVSMDLLNEIGRAVKTYDREQAKNKDKNIEKPLAKSPVMDYIKVNEEFNTVKHKRSIMTKELTYKQAGDYLIPDLTLDGAEELEEMPLGKYGMLRETFLEERHPGTYTSMLLTGRLYPHLREIDRQAREQVDRMVAGLKKQNGVDEAMKARDQMGWVQAVNSFTAQAEEVVLTEIVYK